MAKSMAQKLALKPGERLWLLNRPAGYEVPLGELPLGAVVSEGAGPADVVVCFVSTRAALEEQLPRLQGPSRVWIAYPKGKAELHRDIIRQVAQAAGWEAVSLFAIDETWSALRLKKV